MKKFSDLLKNQYTLSDYTNDLFLYHIDLEFSKNINEKYGLSDICKELSNIVCNRLLKLIKSNKNIEEVKFNKIQHNIHNLFCDEIIFKCSISKNETTADYKTNEKHIVIILNLNETDIHNNKWIKIQSIILHELVHIYNNLLIIQKGFSEFKNIYSRESKYGLMYQNSKDFSLPYNPVTIKQFKHRIYLLDKYETNAFINQLCFEIENIKEKLNFNAIDRNIITTNEVYKIVKELDIYKSFMTLSNFIEKIEKNEIEDYEKKYIIKNVFANKISSSELNNIFKNLKTKYLKVLNKLTSIIPKKIAESLKEDVNLDGNLVNLINPKIHSFTM